MEKQLSPKHRALYARCDEVLHYIWDPIGVSGNAVTRDEYESYLPQTFRLLVDSTSKQEIADFLVNMETESMGLKPNIAGADATAEVLLDWRECLLGEGS